jgi:8-oxo-dGTP pyrophosphatase MutT (NUDIX family)
MLDLPTLLRQRLEHRPPKGHIDWEARPAAVLIPLYNENEIWHVLFTRRTDTVEEHRGQVSFPGGLIERQDDSATQAALREADEEIGLRREDVQVLGALKPLPTVTGFIVSPIVGTFPWPYPLSLNQNEVASAFGVPIDWLSNPDNLEVRQQKFMADGPSFSVYYFKPYNGEIIWGATARITISLLSILQSPS